MSIEAMKLALFALDIVKIHYTQNRHINEAIIALKERLAQPPQRTEQEPVVYLKPDLLTLNHSRDCRFHDDETYCTCYAEAEHKLEFWRSRAITPPAQPAQRTWVGLTDEDMYVVSEEESCSFIAGAKWSEEILKGKNT